MLDYMEISFFTYSFRFKDYFSVIKKHLDFLGLLRLLQFRVAKVHLEEYILLYGDLGHKYIYYLNSPSLFS